MFEKVSDQEYTQDEIRIHDRTDMPFVPDPAALGKWIVQDLVDHPDCFSPGVQNFPKDGLFFRSISLEDNGNALVQYKGKPVSPLKWTNGFLLDQKNSIAEAYVVRRIDGVEYLLIEWKSGDYLFGGRRPDWYVFTRES